MPRIPFPSDDDLTDQARELLEQVEGVHGFVPNQHRLDAYLPLILRSLLALNRRVILGGNLDPDVLERIALILALENDCDYCIAYHLDVLAARGVDRRTLDQLREDWRQVEFPPRRAALVDFSVAVNADPHSVTQEDLDRLRGMGFSEADLVQLVHFVVLMRGYNIFNVVFQTDLDSDGGGWME